MIRERTSGELTMTSAESLQQSAGEDSLNGRVHAIFDDSEHAVFGVDAQGHIGYWNQQCEQLFKLPQNTSIKGKHSSDFLCGGDQQCEQDKCGDCAVNRHIQTEEQINDLTLTIAQADGSPLTVNIGTCYFYQQDPLQACTYFSLQVLA